MDALLSYVGAASIALALWSLEILRGGALHAASGVAGCVVAAGCLAALFLGLRLDVHGFGAVILAEAAWQILVGRELRSGRSRRVPGELVRPDCPPPSVRA